MKLVHKSLTARIAALSLALAAYWLPAVAEEFGNTAYLANYNPATGFKPLRMNLTEIFLQAAGSMECNGSPEPYLRHMQAEHQRIAAGYKAKTGRELEHAWPAYMTDAYIDQLVENWNQLSTKLPLAQLAKKAGYCTRRAICGPDGRDTMLVEVLNQHQSEVMETMRGKGDDGVFPKLKAALSADLEFLPKEQVIAALVEREANLDATEKKEYGRLLEREHFSKGEFGLLEHFYKGPYDKLSERGKLEMSRRVWDGVRGPPPDRGLGDAVKSAQEFREVKAELFKRIDTALKPETAQKVKTIIDSAFIDLGYLAQSELELAILESAMQ